MAKLQPAVKKETMRVTVFTFAAVLLMIIVFAVGHMIVPDQIPFNYKVILGGICGGGVAVLNFFLMALMVQKAAAVAEQQDTVRMIVRSSYTQRLALQIVWIVIAIAVPCFQFIAGILPLLFPSLGIKLRGVLHLDME